MANIPIGTNFNYRHENCTERFTAKIDEAVSQEKTAMVVKFAECQVFFMQYMMYYVNIGVCWQDWTV